MNTFDKTNDWLLQHSRTNPNGLAVITKLQKYTFASLNGLVENAVKVLINSGIKSDDNCALILDNNLEFIISILSLWRIGAVPIPLNVRGTNNELEKQINFTDCKFVIIHKNLKNKFVFNKHKTIEIPFDVANTQKEINYQSNLDKDKISLMLFTSGSTDKPKTVVFTFRNFIYSAIQTINLIEAKESDSWLASLPFYHIGGFMIFIRALMNGSPLIIPESLTQNDIVNSLTAFNPAVISFVPTQLLKIINEGLIHNKNLKVVFLGGGPSESNLIISAKEKGWPIIKVYGSTKTCSMVTALDLRNGIHKVNSAGKPFKENSIFINDKNNKGEIIIKGPSVAIGYYKNPDERLFNGTFYSNDFGFIDEEGYLFIEGRIDDIIISGGENISTKEIENVLFENSNVKDVFVFGTKDKHWGQSVACVVVLKDKKITEESVKEYLKSKLAPYKIPKRIFFANEIPRNDLGKVRKDELLKSLSL